MDYSVTFVFLASFSQVQRPQVFRWNVRHAGNGGSVQAQDLGCSLGPPGAFQESATSVKTPDVSP